MTDDMNVEGTGSPLGPEIGASWYGPPPIPPRPDLPAFPPPDEPVRRRRSPLTIAVAAFLAVLVLVGSGIGIGTLLSRVHSGGSAGAVSTSFADSTGVVDIDTFTTRTGLHQGPDFPLGAGTGMIITASGQVLTNNHVIEGATRIQVTIPGGGVYVARVLGADPTDDVALLQMEGASRLRTITIADSSTVRLADRVVAVGNALGKGGDPAVAPGSVWGLDQSIEVRDVRGELDPLDGVIQVRAAVRPGDSGGPLENEDGDVVGMITAADAHTSGAASRVAFAIPSNDAIGIVQRIRSGESGTSIVIGDAGYLGVRVQDLSSATASSLGLSTGEGAFVASVMIGSPAAGIGMQGSSVITSVDGHAVASADDLGPLIHFHSPGERIDVTWVDTAGTHTASAALVAGPAV
jgi:S1-C subfamily serine protease